MNTTNYFAELIVTGLNNYLEKHGDRIEGLGDPLFEHKETSVMLNCYVDGETDTRKPIFEFENIGHVTQFDSFEGAFNAFVLSNGGGFVD